MNNDYKRMWGIRSKMLGFLFVGVPAGAVLITSLAIGRQDAGFSSHERPSGGILPAIEESSSLPLSSERHSPAVPSRWINFPSATLSEQKAKISSARTARFQDPETLRFLCTVLASQEYQPVIRNVAADILADARWDFPKVAIILTRACNDNSEQPLWRDYALQHLERIAEIDSHYIHDVVTLLRTIAVRGGDRSDTALLVWYRLEQKTARSTSQDLEACLSHLLTAPGGNINAKAVSLGIIADLGAFSDDAAVKACLTDAAPHVRRAAAHSIGAIGIPEDAALLEQMAHQDADPLVRIAAQMAWAKLAERSSHPAADSTTSTHKAM